MLGWGGGTPTERVCKGGIIYCTVSHNSHAVWYTHLVPHRSGVFLRLAFFFLSLLSRHDQA